MWSSKVVSTAAKICLNKDIVIWTVIYTSETWKDTGQVTKKLNVFHPRCLCRTLLVTYQDQVMNDGILKRAAFWSLHEIMAEHRLWLADHILHMPIHQTPKTSMLWTPLAGKLKWGRPKVTWHETFHADVQWFDVRWEESESIAASHPWWRQLAAWCTQKHRSN